MLGIRDEAGEAESNTFRMGGWNDDEREVVRAKIADRQPFLDYVFSRINSNGSQQKFQVSGEPMFDRSCRFIGYRGVGVRLSQITNVDGR